MYNWVTVLYRRDWCNIVNQLYFSNFFKSVSVICLQAVRLLDKILVYEHRMPPQEPVELVCAEPAAHAFVVIASPCSASWSFRSSFGSAFSTRHEAGHLDICGCWWPVLCWNWRQSSGGRQVMGGGVMTWDTR